MKNTKKGLDPSIELEKQLSKQIYDAMQGEVVNQVIKLCSTSSHLNYWRNSLEGHSIKVTKQILSRLYELFNEVKETLCFKEDVDFYITSNSDVNAFSVMSTKEGEPHIINVNSALIQLMTEDELKFVIGHEFGHLINKDMELLQLINFVFPNQSSLHVALKYKIRLWNQLAELVADHYGYLAMPDLNVCVSAFFKLSSGLDFEKMGISMDTFLVENNERLKYFSEDDGMSVETHPINPIRVQSLNLFANMKSDRELKEQMKNLIAILLKVRSSKLDYYIASFIASAGLIVASCDDEIADKEMECVLKELSNYQMFPQTFLDQVADGDVAQTFNESVRAILEIDPSMKDELLVYVMGIVMADLEFHPKEVELIYDLGQHLFGYTEKEVAQLFAAVIQQGFQPDPLSIA